MKKVIDVIDENTMQSLPMWVLENIDSAYFINDSNNTIEIADGRRYSITNSVNHLSGSEWTKQICSVINTKYSTRGEDSYAHHIRRVHPTPKPPQLMKELIEFFTKEGDVVLDYFMGVGGSLLGASLCGRRAVGIDLNEIYVETYKKAAEFLNLSEQSTLVGDSNELLSDEEQMMNLLGEKAKLILIDPPYANMMAREKTGSDIKVYGKIATPFTHDSRDLGNIPKELFIPNLKSIIEKSMKYLSKKGYLIVFCKDLQPKKKETNLLHAEIVAALNEIPSLYYRGMKIWADQTAKLFPYGYPFEFVANQIHQYILIFRKY